MLLSLYLSRFDLRCVVCTILLVRVHGVRRSTCDRESSRVAEMANAKKTRSRWVVGEVWTHAGDEDECDEMSRLLVIAYRRKATGIANDTTIEVLPRSASGRRSTERRPARSGEGRIRNIDARVLIWRHLLNYYTYKCSLRVGFPYTFHSALRPFAPTTLNRKH